MPWPATARRAWRPAWTTTSASPSVRPSCRQPWLACQLPKRPPTASGRVPRAAERRNPVPPPDLLLVDEAVLADLLASTGDDPAFVRELLETYLAETPDQLAAIRAAIEADDAEALVRPAHTLKSSSATLGAMRLSALARELEMAGRSGSLAAD